MVLTKRLAMKREGGIHKTQNSFPNRGSTPSLKTGSQGITRLVENNTFKKSKQLDEWER